ncbi:MAG: glutathione S-transferase family protein [Parasphingorhabdus sp.]
MASRPTLHIRGTVISTYTRIVQTVAEEAGVVWSITATPAQSEENKRQHPFQKVPTVEIDGLNLYESVAITQYIDNAHNAASLQPEDSKVRAEMDRWIAIANNYLFPVFEHGLLMPRLAHEYLKTPLRSDIIEAAIPDIAHHLGVICDRIEQTPHFAGADFSLADIFIYCITRPVQLTPEGANLIGQLLPLRHWLNRIGKRESLIATRWPVEVEV